MRRSLGAMRSPWMRRPKSETSNDDGGSRFELYAAAAVHSVRELEQLTAASLLLASTIEEEVPPEDNPQLFYTAAFFTNSARNLQWKWQSAGICFLLFLLSSKHLQLSSLRVCGCYGLNVTGSNAPNLSNLAIDGKGNQQRMRHASVFEDSPSLRKIDECNYYCLKSVKISGFTSAKSLVALTCHVLKNAVSLESIALDTLYGWRCSEENRGSCCPMGNGILRESPRAFEAIRTYITDKVTMLIFLL